MRRAALYSAAAAIALSSAAALPAVAQTTTNANPRMSDEWRMPWQRNFWGYIGASVGRSDYDLNCFSGFSCDQRATGFKVFAGGKVYNAVGAELSYVNLGRAEVAGGRTRADGVNASLVLGIPVFGDTFGINGKVGTTYGWTRSSSSIPGLDTGKESGWGLSYGAGATYAFTRNMELRVDWDRYRFDFRGNGDQDVDLISVGLNFRF